MTKKHPFPTMTRHERIGAIAIAATTAAILAISALCRHCSATHPSTISDAEVQRYMQQCDSINRSLASDSAATHRKSRKSPKTSKMQKAQRNNHSQNDRKLAPVPQF